MSWDLKIFFMTFNSTDLFHLRINVIPKLSLVLFCKFLSLNLRGFSYLVLLQIPKCFVPVQIFWARPKIYLHIVAVKIFFCQTKRWFAFSKMGFCAGTKSFEEALNAIKLLVLLKKVGLSQKFLGPVKGQGSSLFQRKTIRYFITTVGANRGLIRGS